jgi:hypothetical protein
VGGKEDIQQIGITDHRGVVGDTDRFGMAGRARTDLFIGRIGALSTDIATFHGLHALEVLIDRLGTPEASPGQCRDFLRHNIVLIHVASSDREDQAVVPA